MHFRDETKKKFLCNLNEVKEKMKKNYQNIKIIPKCKIVYFFIFFIFFVKINA